MSSEERDQGGTRRKVKKNKTKSKSDKAPKKDEQRGWGRAGGGGCREPTKAQVYKFSPTEKRHADDPHGPVPAAPPDHQGTDGGEASEGGRRGSPPEGVSGEAAQVGLQVGGQGGGPEARESARDTTMARGRPAESTLSRRTTVRGRAGDRREGRVESREMSETRGMGAHLAWPGAARGHAPGGRWDRTRPPRGALTDGLCRVDVGACREEGTTRQEARRGSGGAKKNTNKTPERRRRARSAERAGGGGTGWSKRADERPRLAREKKGKKNNDGRPGGGKARVTGGAGARRKEPPQVQKRAHHPSGRGREGSEQC